MDDRRSDGRHDTTDMKFILLNEVQHVGLYSLDLLVKETSGEEGSVFRNLPLGGIH